MNIAVEHVTKTFGEKTALRNLSLQLEANKIYGLLGRNGAGKTTLMQMLAGHITPTDGQVKVEGLSPFENREVLKNICFISENNNFKKKLKIKDVLKVASLVYPNWSQDIANDLLTRFNLEGKMSTKGLSKGMESALGITIGLASQAPLTIFDEPYIGLDASARYLFYDLILEAYEEKPRTIILSTHLIDEVSNLFEEVVVIQKGKKLLHETAENMMNKALHISGKEEVVDAFIKNQNVIYESTLVGKKSAVLYGEFHNPSEVREHGLTIESINVQQLMVYLTEDKRSAKLYV